MQNFVEILEFFILGILDFQQKDFYLKICFKILLGILEFLQKRMRNEKTILRCLVNLSAFWR